MLTRKLLLKEHLVKTTENTKFQVIKKGILQFQEIKCLSHENVVHNQTVINIPNFYYLSTQKGNPIKNS